MVADAAVLDVVLETLPDDSGGHFFPTGINKLRVAVDPVTRGDGSSSTIGTTMHHTVADAAVSDVVLKTLPDDSDSRFSPTVAIDRDMAKDLLALDGQQQLKHDLSTASDGSIIYPSDIINLHAVLDADVAVSAIVRRLKSGKNGPPPPSPPGQYYKKKGLKKNSKNGPPPPPSPGQYYKKKSQRRIPRMAHCRHRRRASIIRRRAQKRIPRRTYPPNFQPRNPRRNPPKSPRMNPAKNHRTSLPDPLVNHPIHSL